MHRVLFGTGDKRMTIASDRKFDLTKEGVLESWGVANTTREVIANALDE